MYLSRSSSVLLLLLSITGLCWTLPQDAYFGSANHRGADYDLYVDFEHDYYDSDPQQPKEDPPVFVESGQHFVVGEGDSIVFNCATVKPSSHVMIIKKLTKDGHEGQLFYVGDVKIHRDRRIILKDGLLNMTMLRERDQGDYTCYYEANPVVQVIHTLEVKFAPKILFYSDDASVSQGESLTLECLVEGNPKPRIIWYSRQGPLPSGKQEEEGPTLMLDGLNKSIIGTYTCKAENGLGTASETVSVTSNDIQDQNINIKIEKVIMQTGWDSTLKLICTAHGVSTASFRWEKDGIPIEQDPTLRMNGGNTLLMMTETGGDKSTISLPLVSSEDFGNYSCIVESALDSTRSTIFVDDQPQKAKFTSDPEGTEDTSYLVTWESESNAPVIWYMVAIRNILDEDSEVINVGMFQNADIIAEHNIYTISHELKDLIPNTEYEVTIQVNNNFKWSEQNTFNFSTKGETSTQRTSVTVMPSPSTQETSAPVMPSPSSNLEWCEWPLETVGSECLFFSDILESEEDSRHKITWRNAQQFCEDNGGNLAQLSELNHLQEHFNEKSLLIEDEPVNTQPWIPAIGNLFSFVTGSQNSGAGREINRNSENTEKYWIGGRRDSEYNIMWLSGENVRPDWIVNARDSDYTCLQYWPSENILHMGSCEENYRWICEKTDPSSQNMETNIFAEEEEVKIEDTRQYYENQQEPTVNLQNKDSISQPQQSLNEQGHGTQQPYQSQEGQLQVLEQQMQDELERQHQRQQQSIIQQQQQQQIPEQEVIQKLTSTQLESQKQLKLQQKKKQKQSKDVTREPEIQVVENVQTEQTPHAPNKTHKSSMIDTLENQEVSTTNKESVGEYQPLRYLCPPNFLRLGNSCYYFGSEMATWHAAHFACRDRDSQLITLETQWEDITIRHYLSKPEFARLNRWVGGIYNWSTQRWMWGPSGQVMPYLGFLTSVPPTSSRWHCVFMAPSLNYRWNHELCTTAMHFICESPQSKSPDSQDIGYAP